MLSAFSGLGGLDLGLEAAGFSHVGCIEHDEWARRSLKANRGDEWPLLDPCDITVLSSQLRPSTLGLKRRELGLLAGGPPCQPFSKAAQWSAAARVGLDDVRSHCLLDFLHLVDVFLPKALLIENVSGFVQGDVSALGLIEDRLRAINRSEGTSYELQKLVVDAADYGVPQRRNRALLVACRDGEVFQWPKITHADNPITAWDAIGDLQLKDEELPKPVGKWAALLPSIPEGGNYLWHTERGGGEPIFGYRTRFWSFLLKLKKNEPSWTLPAQPGPSTGPFHWDNRPLAIRELLRLQSFPDDWVVEGDHRDQVDRSETRHRPCWLRLLDGHWPRSCSASTSKVDASSTVLIELGTFQRPAPDDLFRGTSCIWWESIRPIQAPERVLSQERLQRHADRFSLIV